MSVAPACLCCESYLVALRYRDRRLLRAYSGLTRCRSLHAVECHENPNLGQSGRMRRVYGQRRRRKVQRVRSMGTGQTDTSIYRWRSLTPDDIIAEFWNPTPLWPAR
jgi:hypothetical protein